MDDLARIFGAQADALAILSATANDDDSPLAGHDRRLQEGLQNAINARSLIPVEQARISEQIEKAEPGSARYRYLIYQRDLVGLQLDRAADFAQRRLQYLSAIRTKQQQEIEKEKCRDGIEGLLHWFDYWAWTADPRPDAPLYAVPFGLFDFQREAVRWIWSLVYTLRQDGLIDKSRDMGISWIAVGFAAGNWLNADKRSPFSALFGSRKEDFVDKRGDMDTLFEKLRFIISYLPSWMMPRGWNPKQCQSFMSILNPETGSALKGESSNDDFGRGGRQTIIIPDEFASFPGGGYAAWTACSESTRTRLPISTPKGKFNKFAELRFDGATPTLSLHWKQHPWKSEGWYDFQATRMTSVERAQELDLDYEGSLAGRLLPMWDERVHVITWSEFADYFGKPALDGDGKPRIPANWQIGWAHDVGTTADHPAVVIMAATAAEDSKLPGAVFFFQEIVIPENGTPLQMAPLIKQVADPWDLWAWLNLSLISHEANSERLIYETLGISFVAWDTDQGYTQGYSQLQVFLTPDKSLVHPFRPDVRLPNGEALGCPRLFVVVGDEDGGLVPDETLGWRSRPARKPKYEDISVPQTGFARLRLEFPNIHIPTSELGKPARARRHFKKLDDAFDCCRALAAQFFPGITEETFAQRLRKRLQERFGSESRAASLDDNPAGAVIGMLEAQDVVRRELEAEDYPDGESQFNRITEKQTGREFRTIRTSRAALPDLPKWGNNEEE